MFQKNTGILVEINYPDEDDVTLSRLFPLLEWLFTIPHVIILSLFFLLICLIASVCWLSVFLTGRYPDGAINFTRGLPRWWLRVYAYGWMPATDQYPPFSLAE